MTEPGARFFIVGVGASAGGIDALKLFFQSAPTSPDFGFVVITHLSPDHKSLLAEILQGFTEMPVHTIKDGMRVEPGTVYVVPERVAVTIRNGRLVLKVEAAGADRQKNVKVIDEFFRSLAEDQADFAIGAILSGLDHDGSLGAKAIKEHGGLTIAQIANGTAPKFPDMPENAIASGFIDLEVPAEQMIARLVEFARGSRSLGTKHAKDGDEADVGVVAFKGEIAEIIEGQLGHDFRGYKDATFARRVRRRMAVQNLSTTTDYVAFLKQDTAEVNALFNDLLINVTRFFRDPDAFQNLAENVLPKLMKGRSANDVVRVWVPGCATGEEAFSIAILIREALDKVKSAPSVQIFATDIDEEALSVARAARFPLAIREDLTKERLQRFFVETETEFVLSRDVRELCIFSPHSLLRDPPFSRIDLASCRNLLIYLHTDTQQQILRLLHYALHASGYLFLGQSESVSHQVDLFEPVDRKHRIFKARGNMRPMPATLFAAQAKRGLTDNSPRQTTPGTLRRECEAQLLDRHAPPHVLVNAAGEVVFFSAETSQFLQHSAGAPTLQLADLARKGMRLEIRRVLRHALETRTTVRSEELTLQLGSSRVQPFMLTIEPLQKTSANEPLLLVLFQTCGPERQVGATDESSPNNDEREITALDKELKETRERLQATIEEYETAMEELRSSNEELVSLNEEHQSTNEELEASREEMQSLNEELHTVNSELKINIQELDAANNDLQHFFDSARTATVFLDSNLTIRNYTPPAMDLFRIQPTDKGRPLTDLSLRFGYPGFGVALVECLETGMSHEEEVIGEDGSKHYHVDLRPYSMLRGGERGLIVTASDVSALVKARANEAPPLARKKPET